MKTAFKTLKKYETYLLNMMDYSYTNGGIEGINNKIKVIKRTAFSFRSFYHFKAKILYIQIISLTKKVAEKRIKEQQKNRSSVIPLLSSDNILLETITNTS